MRVIFRHLNLIPSVVPICPPCGTPGCNCHTIKDTMLYALVACCLAEYRDYDSSLTEPLSRGALHWCKEQLAQLPIGTEAWDVCGEYIGLVGGVAGRLGARIKCIATAQARGDSGQTVH
jgi:hypothetical protein